MGRYIRDNIREINAKKEKKRKKRVKKKEKENEIKT
jgi:hypothetical protein